MCDRAFRNWQQSFVNGYMPADFDWPYTKAVLRTIKEKLEKQLEITTNNILLRATSYAVKNIDFKRRFPNEGFDDVGDFDGFAYWPETNQWVVAECKYNQGAYCLKDAKRLRDRIFGTSSRRGQFDKIVKRRIFFQNHIERIRSLLDWPQPANSHPLVVHELYVSRDIFWWMLNPPYCVPTNFVRIDLLDNWLRQNELLK